jgi:PKD repeat protein
VSPTAGEPVQFTDTSGGSPQWWGWSFGDGTAGSSERNPVRTYLSPGNFTVMLSTYCPGSAIGRDVTRAFTGTPAAFAVPPSTALPADTNGDGKYDEVNDNGRKDFANVVLYLKQMSWISANEPISAFDYNGNGRIDFADVVRLFNNL